MLEGIIQMTISSSILIVAIVILRAVFLHKVCKKVFMILWMVAILRLIVPFSISSPFSVYTMINNITNMAIRESKSGGFQSVRNVEVMSNNTQIVPEIASGAVGGIISPILLLWLIGCIVYALFITITHLRCRREYAMSLPVVDEFTLAWREEHPTKRKVEIRQSDKISSPMTYGIWRPIVLLPKTIEYSDIEQMEYILTHEFTHIKRFDCQW